MTWRKVHDNPTMPISISLTVSYSIERVVICWVTLIVRQALDMVLAKKWCKENILPSTPSLRWWVCLRDWCTGWVSLKTRTKQVSYTRSHKVSGEREWYLGVWEREREWIIPFPKFGNGKGIEKKTHSLNLGTRREWKKTIPKIREWEGNEKIYSQN